MSEKTVFRFYISLKETFSNYITFTVINKYGKKCCRSDCKLVFDLFTMMLVEGSSEKEFLDIYLTTFFGVFNFGKTSAMGVTFQNLV